KANGHLDQRLRFFGTERQLVAWRRITAFVIGHATFLILWLGNRIGVHLFHRFVADRPTDTALNQLEEPRIAERALVMAEGGIKHPAFPIFLRPRVGLTARTVYPFHQYLDIISDMIVYIGFVPF